MIHISDHVIDQIGELIAQHPPELGGALLGPAGDDVVTHFIFDDEARVTNVTYSPSRSLNKKIQEVELNSNLEWKGIVHSHPGMMNYPSGGDEVEIGANFRLNPHIKKFFCPIVTTHYSKLEQNELPCGPGKISLYIALRSDEPRVACQILAFSNEDVEKNNMYQSEQSVIETHVQKAGEHFNAKEVKILNPMGDNNDLIPVLIVLHGGELMLLTSSKSYPMVAPTILFTPDGEDTKQINPVWWNLDIPDDERLINCLSHIIVKRGAPSAKPFRQGFGLSDGSNLTTDPSRAELAGWKSIITQEEPAEKLKIFRDALFARSNGILSESISDSHVLIVGLGSGGSYIAKELIRCGVGKITLIDSEAVELPNLSRTEYCIQDINISKTKALSRRLLNINPSLKIEIIESNLQDIPLLKIKEIVTDCDIVIAATDDAKAQSLLGHFSYFLNKPAVFGGMYAGAQGGEVIYTLPDKTSCFLCATRVRQKAEERSSRVSADSDYGTGRLIGEMALSVDIQHVSSAAVKIALSLLLKTINSDANLAKFVDLKIESRENYVTFSTVPDYWFYPQIFEDVAGQFAYQSVWMSVAEDGLCPICGNPDLRSDPINTVIKTPSVSLSDLNIDAKFNNDDNTAATS